MHHGIYLLLSIFKRGSDMLQNAWKGPFMTLVRQFFRIVMDKFLFVVFI